MSDDEEVIAELLLEAEEAREDVAKFFEFVLREEGTAAPIRVIPLQRLIFEFVEAHRNSVLMIPVEHTKCHGRGTPILMADGTTRAVEDVRKGDWIMGYRAPTRVLNTTGGGRGMLYRVTPKRGGNPFVCNEDHLLTIVDSETGRIDDVTIRDWLGWSKWKRSTSSLVRASVRRFHGERPLPVDPYFLGVWFGDGLHSVRHGVRLTSIDPEVRSMCMEIAHAHGLHVVPLDEQSFGLSRPGGKGAGKGQGRRPNPLMEKIREAVEGDSLTMTWAKTAPWADRAEFLAGFIDADGCAKDGCIWITQKNADWARDIAFIARSLGLRVCEGSFEHPEYGTYRRLTIAGDAFADIPIRLARKRVTPATKVRRALWTHFKVEPIGVDEFFGVTIGGDGRYLLGDFTVTHNTFSLAGYTLWKIGHDPLLKAAVVSASEGQAKKPFSMIRQYIESSPELQFVFPTLRRSSRMGDSWTTTELIVDRPPGSKDPSLVARGQDSKQIRGSRWGFCHVDDLSNEENTHTPEAREALYRWLSSTLFTRMDSRRGKVVVTCVALHQDDTTHRLMMSQAEGGPGWPGMIMRSNGTILLRNCPRFDSDLIRPDDDLDPSNPLATYRLVAHDHLPEGERTLWPERWPRELLEERRGEMHPVEFERNYNNVCRDDSTALCKQEYVDKALALGRKMGFKRIASSAEEFLKYNGAPRGGLKNWIYGGVDLAFSQSAAADETAIFVLGVFPDDNGKMQIRVPMWLESGKWGTDELAKKLEWIDERFDHLPFGFENNGAQEGVRRLMVTSNKSLILKEHRTDASKNSIQNGVPSIFGEMANGAWAIPNEGRPAEGPLKKWIDQCLHYVPSAHTGDLLMSSFFALETARRFGAIRKTPLPGGKGPRRATASMLVR